MKFKLAVLASAVAMAVAGQASAALTNLPSSGNGDLFFTAWDDTGKSFTQALGVRLNDFLPNTFTYPSSPTLAGDPTSGTRTPEAGTSFTVNLSDVFNTLFPATATGFFWNIVAGDQLQAGGAGIRRALLTGIEPGSFTNSALQTLTQNIQNFAAAPGVISGEAGPTSGLGNGNDGTWGSKIGIGASSLDTAASGFTSTGFWYLGSSSTTAGNQAYRLQYANATASATWTLESDGDLVYSLAGVTDPPPVGDVPLPAAGWLLLSGLLSLGAVARRRIAAQ